ncbi:MAG: J domain-containing protein, partial [Microthrixaceae bacterium]
AARFTPELDPDFHDELLHLMVELEAGRRIAQPRLRHRLQEDHVGLQRCVHRLTGEGERLEFHFDDAKGTAAHHVLCAVYAAATVPWALVPTVMSTVRKGFLWKGGSEAALLGHLSGRQGVVALGAVGDPVAWAMDLLDLRAVESPAPTRQDVQRAYRVQLRAAHPDHGAAEAGAAQRIAEIGEARRILLG